MVTDPVSEERRKQIREWAGRNTLAQLLLITMASRYPQDFQEILEYINRTSPSPASLVKKYQTCQTSSMKHRRYNHGDFAAQIMAELNYQRARKNGTTG